MTEAATAAAWGGGSNDGAMMLRLLLWLFIYYALASVVVAAVRSGVMTKERYALAALILAGAYRAFGAYVLEMMLPELLRLFGVGGQGFLHLLSLRWVDPRDLTFHGVASRVVAGSYTAVLAAMFFIPLLFAVSFFLWNLYDALSPPEAANVSVDADGAEEGDALPNGAAHAGAGAGGGFMQNVQERWLLKRFDMDAFEVLSSLGKGVTSTVVLAKVRRDLDFAGVGVGGEPRKSASGLPSEVDQAGNLWGDTDEEDALSGGGSRGPFRTTSQRGNLWGSALTLSSMTAGSVSEHDPFTSSAVPSAVSFLAPPTTTTTTTTTSDTAVHGGNVLAALTSGHLPPRKHSSVNVLDALLDTVLVSESDGGRRASQYLSSPVSKRIESDDAPTPHFGPGAGHGVEPALNQGFAGWNNFSLDVDAPSPKPTVAQTQTQMQPHVQTPPRPSPLLNTAPTAATNAGAASPTLLPSGIKRNPTFTGLARNTKSFVALVDLAGGDLGGASNWYPKTQFIDRTEIDRTGYDKVYPAAPGLVPEARSLSDLALEREGGLDMDTPFPDTPAAAAAAAAAAATTASVRRRVSSSSVSAPGGGSRSRRGESDGSANTLASASAGAGLVASPAFRPTTKTSVASLGIATTDDSVMLLPTTASENTNNGGAGSDIRRLRSRNTTDNLADEGRHLVENLDEMPELVALKIMHKADIERMGMRRTVENERRALAMCASPFVCDIFGAFQDDRWAYLLLEPVPAGDLAGLLEQRQIMFEDEARFYVACLLLALEHIHSRGIACLDVKPENMLLDQYGYLKLCDLGISRIRTPKQMREERERVAAGDMDEPKWEFVGTPEYMSPEVVERAAVAPGRAGVAGPDAWAVGVLLFELLIGETPFAGESNNDTLDAIRAFSAEFARAKATASSLSARLRGRFTSSAAASAANGGDGASTSSTLGPDDAASEGLELLDSRALAPLSRSSPQAQHLVHRLLRPDPLTRLGCRSSGVRAVMTHEWFHDFDWNALRRREVRAPFVPNPVTLAPPFRGEACSTDITNALPLRVSQLQRVQDHLRRQADRRRSSSGGDDAPRVWKGFLPVVSPTPSSGGAAPLPANAVAAVADAEFHALEVHYRQLFPDEDDA